LESTRIYRVINVSSPVGSTPLESFWANIHILYGPSPGLSPSFEHLWEA